MSEDNVSQSPSPEVFGGVFAEGGPDVAIGGISITRSTITSVSSHAVVDDQELSWEIHCLPATRNSEGGGVMEILLATGDLRVRDQSWFVATTARATVCFRDGKVPIDISDLGQVNEYSKLYGSWSAHLLYDTCLAEARRLIAGVTAGGSCTLDLPTLTPTPTFVDLVAADDE